MINLNQAPYLRAQRQFPYDNTRELANQVDHAYIDIAGKVNTRVIGTYPTNVSVVTGEKFYLSGQTNDQQTLRQVYLFTSAGSINHNLQWGSVAFITKPWGSYTDGTNYYGIMYASGSITGQYTFYVTPTQIVVQAGAGAPSITSGMITIEWLSQY